MKSNKILVANIGSTSFKFRLYSMPEEKLLAKGGVERIGQGEGPWQIQLGSDPVTKGANTFADHRSAIDFVSKALSGKVVGDFTELAAIGFKVVAAKDVSGTQVLDGRVLKAMEDFYTLLPAHNPPYVNAVRACQALYPAVPCIGTFETAFYDFVPPHNRRYPIPLEWEQKYGIRRFGFHGASHRYVSSRAAQLRGTNTLRVISCHLGGSSSIACVKDGQAINSSWGMTPQSGLPQNNRVGDFDVFAAIYLARNLGLGLDEVEKALNSQSGLKGMSGLPSGDLRDIEASIKAGNENAKIALQVFVGSIRKFIGQFLVEMGGADVIAFAGGIGENSHLVRGRVCQGLEFCGIDFDSELNEKILGQEAVLTRPGSKVEVRVIPTNEEIIIAREAWKLLNS